MRARNTKVKLLPLIMALSFLLSCCGTEPEKDDTSDDERKEPMEIVIAYWNVQDYLTGDAVQTYIENKFDVKFVPVNANYENYPFKYQEMASANNLPDIFVHDIMGTSAYESWVKEGKIRAIPKDMTQYPNLDAYLSQPYNDRFKKSDGYFYAIPRITYEKEELWALDRCVLVRRDWMESLGLSMPQSWEDFVAMLEAFVHRDPDGNGKDDTGGLTAANMNTLEAVYLSVFPELSNTERGWLYEDGQWMPAYHAKSTGEALTKMQELYQKGLLAEDFGYISSAMAKEAFASGRVGAICMQYFAMLNYLNSLGRLDEAADMVGIMPPWPAPDGNRYRFTTSLHWSEIYFGAGVNNEKMKRILEILEWILSDDFESIWQYGLKDVDWRLVNGVPVPMEGKFISPLVKYPSMSVFSYLVEWKQDNQYETTDANRMAYRQENLEYAQEMLQWYEQNTKRVNYNYDIVFMSTPAKNNLMNNKLVQNEMAKVIMGYEDARTAWPKALDRIKGSTCLEEAIDEVTAEAKRFGIAP